MALSTLLLTLSTCVSMGTGSLIQGQSIERTKDRAVDLLTIATENFDPFDFINAETYTEEQGTIDLKLTLLDSITRFDLISDDLKEPFEKIKFDELSPISGKTSFTIEEIESNVLFQDSDDEGSIATNFFADLLDTTRFIESNEEKTQTATFISSNGSTLEKEEEAVIEDVTTEVDNVPQIPLIEGHDNTKMEVQINGKRNGELFIGYNFPADTCISFYNLVSGWLNKKMALQNSNIPSFWTQLILLIKSNATTGEIYASILAALSRWWNEFSIFMETGGIFAVILAVLIALMAAAIIGGVILLWDGGRRQVGRRLGFVAHSFFDWEFINEDYR